jgi:hypothetical protein
MKVEEVIRQIKVNFITVYLKSVDCEYILTKYPCLNLLFTDILKEIFKRSILRKYYAITLVRKLQQMLNQEDSEITFFVYMLLTGICEQVRFEYEIKEEYEVCSNCLTFLKVINIKLRNIEKMLIKNLNIAV